VLAFGQLQVAALLVEQAEHAERVALAAQLADLLVLGERGLEVSDGLAVVAQLDRRFGDGAQGVGLAAEIAEGVAVGALGDLAPTETRTVVFTLRVKDTASPGNLTLQHQFVGDNYAFDVTGGPVLTITGTPQTADVAVGLTATPRGILTSRITYVITVSNNGPSVATDVRVTATYASGLSYGSSSDCSRVSGTRNVNCDVSSLAPGASTTLRFTANAGLLALGSFTTTAQRTQSTPADPNAANDKAAKSCSALTGLLVSC